MKTKNTLLLLLVAMGAFAYIWFVDRHQQGTRDREQDGTLIAKFDRDDIDAIDIRSTEGKIDLRKDAKGRWQIVEPVQDRADTMAIAQLFTEAESLRYVDKIDEDGKGVSKERLKEFGLNEATAKLRLAGNKGKPIELQWGKDTATEGRQYLKLDGSSVVYVVGGPLKATLTRRADEFRDKKLGNLSTAEVNKVTVKTSAGEIEVSRDESNRWSLVKPMKARGDDARIGDLIAQAANARIESFVGDAANLSTYGLQEPRATVTLHTGEGEPVALDLGTNPKDEKDKERTYAKISTRQAVVLLPKAIESLISTKPNDLRDRSLLRVESDIVDRVTVEGPDGGKVVLARSGESWVRKAGDKDSPVDAPLVQTAVATLTSQQVSEFVADVATELAKYGLDRPAVKVTLSSYASENTAETKAGEKPIVTVLFGKIDADKVFAKLDDEPFIVSIPATVVDLLPTDPLAWQPTKIFNDQAENIVALEVMREGQPTLSLELDKEKKWKLAKGDGAVNQTHVTSLVSTLASLRAVRWIGATTAEHGLENPKLTVNYKTAGGSSRKLRLGVATEDELWHAGADGLAGTFLVSAPDKSAFGLVLIEKPAAAPSPDAVPPRPPAAPQ